MKYGQLPASASPNYADSYVCDRCGRDITKHFHVGGTHIGQTIGPIRYVCRCGETYLTGHNEWDFLGDRERRLHLGFRIAFSGCACVVFTIIAVLLSIVLKVSATVAVIVAVVPTVLSFAPDAIAVARSIRRTRFGKERSERSDL